jgi:DNA-binding response OmpR family regulator
MTARVLIADVDPILTEVYRDHLTDRGFAVKTALTGLSCLGQLRQFRPDLLVVGTSLLWGGCEGVLAVMEDEYDLRPEIVMVLAQTRDRNRLHRLASHGIDSVQWKPLSPARLIRYVETLLLEHADQHRAGAILADAGVRP